MRGQEHKTVQTIIISLTTVQQATSLRANNIRRACSSIHNRTDIPWIGAMKTQGQIFQRFIQEILGSSFTLMHIRCWLLATITPSISVCFGERRWHMQEGGDVCRHCVNA